MEHRVIAVRAVVVGGGIAGLAAARMLGRHLGPREVALVEGADRLGGKIVTERIDGFLVEGGPDSLLSAKPAGVELCRELGLADRLIGTSTVAHRAGVRRAGRVHELPEGLSGLVPGRVLPLLRSALLTPGARWRAALELLTPPRGDTGDESVAAFATRRFGREAYDWLIEPLLSGIYAADGAELSLDATFPQLRSLELAHGSVLRGVLRRAPAAASGLPPFVTPVGGMSELVTALEHALTDVRQLRGARAVRLEAAPGTPVAAPRRWRVTLADGTALAADVVVLALPAWEAAGLVAPADAALAAALSGFRFASTATVSLGFSASDVPGPLDRHGVLRPRAEGGPLVACTWTSAKWPGRAPESMVLLRAFIGRAGCDEIVGSDDEALVALAQRELRELLGITASPVLRRVWRWPNGMPQYTLGHRARVARLDTLLRHNAGLHVAGHSYHGVGIPDCIVSGQRAAAAALASVGAEVAA